MLIVLVVVVDINLIYVSIKMSGGQVVFENDNYCIIVGDNNIVNIYNKNIGEIYNIWGDLYVNVDGQYVFDFWGIMIFKFEDGIKVIIEIMFWNVGNGMMFVSKVVIMNGDYGVEIIGVDINKVGDFKINEVVGWGSMLDWMYDDGNVLQENLVGKGFFGVDVNGNIQKVDQVYINKIDQQKNSDFVFEVQ